MNYDALKVWVDVAQFAWIIAATIWAFWGNKDRETKTMLAEHAEQITGLDLRVARVEESDKHNPTHDDIGGVYEKLNDINGEIKEVGGEMKALRAQVELITKHMLDKH